MRNTSGFMVIAVAGLIVTEVMGGELAAGVRWGDPVTAVSATLAKHCASTQTIKVESPSFPLAELEECHVLCNGLQTGRGVVERSVFVFADDQLVMIEARGGAVEAFKRPDAEAENYMHYQIFNDGELWVDTKRDTAWFLNEAAQHPNLFTFDNPYLSGQSVVPLYTQSAAIPPALDFDVALDRAKILFKRDCPLLYTEETSAWLPSSPSKQAQINCFGLQYAGFPRKFEAIYGDGKLELVWILTAKGEEQRVRHALIKEFGPAEHSNDQWEIFAGFRVSLRKDKPEVLLMSDQMVPHYKKELLGETD